MSNIRGKDTKIELTIRKKLWARGIRYRIHCDNVPGAPDICNVSKKIVVFIDGCFWHGCPHCSKKLPDTNKVFWKKKIESNKKRRKKVLSELNDLGYNVFQFWECEIKNNPDKIVNKLIDEWKKN
jgi:DNA mismatch endonuclease (patch repair protein)